MLVQQHPSPLLSDYILNLLSADQERQVEQHLAVCADCRAVVREERSFLRDVRSTIATASHQDSRQLRHLMPSPPNPRRAVLHQLFLRPVAALSLLLILIVGTLQWNQPDINNFLAYPSATTLAVTATHTPTVTGTAEADAALNDEPASVQQERTPFPAGTPLASAPRLSGS